MLFADRFAHSLRRKREELRLTQEELANRLGVSIRTIRRWESGERIPSAYAILKLAKMLDLPPFIDLSGSLEQIQRRKQVNKKHVPNPHTYFVPDRYNNDENLRLSAQGMFFSAAMGGLMVDQPDPARFAHILDVGCGTGGWLIELAQRYPTIPDLVGIDIIPARIAYCQAQAAEKGVTDRVRFEVMDVLGPPLFFEDSFDLVNIRAAVSFVRFWEWGGLITSMKRLLTSHGVLRLTDVHHVITTSPALGQLWSLGLQAAISAGYAISADSDGLPRRFEQMLSAHGFHDVQSKAYHPVYKAGTPEGEFFAEDMTHLFKVAVPFYQKWVHLPDNYDELYVQMIDEVHSPDFETTWPIETVWGIKL